MAIITTAAATRLTKRAYRISGKVSVIMRIAAAVFALCAVAGVSSAQTATLPYDHIHLNVPDQAKAVEWYAKNFGGKPTTEAAERLMFGSTRLIFLRNPNGQPSTGS